MLRYADFINQNKTREDEFEVGHLLKWKIDDELKRYKTFRGFYIFVEQYKKYGFVEKNYQRYRGIIEEENTREQETKIDKHNVIQYQNTESDEFRPKIISNVDEYNKEYDEFLSEEEYADAYGTNDEEYIYTKGVIHDKYTK